MADEPKSCPFCGCEMRVLPDINGAVSDVAMHEENECLLSLTGLPRDKFAAWNTRIEPEAADRGEAWQPIETAPTGNEADGPFFDVAWAGHSHRYLPVPAREVDCYRAGNTIKRRHGYPSVTTIFRPQPTHWRPLPDPPAIQSLRSEQEGGQ